MTWSRWKRGWRWKSRWIWHRTYTCKNLQSTASFDGSELWQHAWFWKSLKVSRISSLIFIFLLLDSIFLWATFFSGSRHRFLDVKSSMQSTHQQESFSQTSHGQNTQQTKNAKLHSKLMLFCWSLRKKIAKEYQVVKLSIAFFLLAAAWVDPGRNALQSAEQRC